MSEGKTGFSRRSAVLAAAGLALAGCGNGSGRTSARDAASSTGSSALPPSPSSAAAPAARPSLPGGGRTLFPQHRLVGYCGMPGAPALGELGVTGDLQRQVDHLLRQAAAYDEPQRTVLPVMELIATVVHPSPGADGMFRERLPRSVIQQWSDTARRNGALLLLNIQPGRADFLDEAKAYEEWLTQPHVSLALDPEWSIRAGQQPGKVFGSTTGGKVDEVAAYLSGVVADHDLPEKPLVVHVLRRSVFTDPSELRQHPGVVPVVSVDGIGVPKDKLKAYRIVLADTPQFVRPGFKLFFSEDVNAGGPLMSPAEVLALSPSPDYVMYE